MRKEINSDRSGIFMFGYIKNDSTYLTDVSRLVGADVSTADLENGINTAYANSDEINFCYDPSGNLQRTAFDPKRTCRYAINTGIIAPNPGYNPDKIYAVFFKDAYGSWSGVKFLKEYQLDNFLNSYHLGNISFRNYSEANAFIKNLHGILLPGETWHFKANASSDFRPKTEYDILQSYLQHTFEKLLQDNNDSDSKNFGKIIFSADQRYALFNSGLLNKFAEDIRLVGEVRGNVGNNFSFSSPQIAKSKVDLIRAYGFQTNFDFPDVVSYFDDDLDEIMFDPMVEIDLSYDRLKHIIDDGAKGNRFSEKYREKYDKGDLPSITSSLKAAIDNSRKIARRNYKYVVPQYRSAKYGEDGKIQFLMPIYLDTQYGEKPDFALVLNRERMPDNTCYYTPETILELSMAYNNARVICKPDDTWLNPSTIDSPPMSVEDEIKAES